MLQSSTNWVTLAERALVLTLKLLSCHLGLGLDNSPPAIIYVMGRPLYTWTPDLKTIIEVCPQQGKTWLNVSRYWIKVPVHLQCITSSDP